jgi:hypothetical protein
MPGADLALPFGCSLDGLLKEINGLRRDPDSVLDFNRPRSQASPCDVQF